jgi:uncharacterized protein (TIGR02594 family)
VIVPSWYSWAGKELGVREIVGPEHNPRVVEYWKLGKVHLDVKDDEVPWCAAFVNAALESCGLPGSHSGRARSFQVGHDFVPCDARTGAIVVLSSDRGAASGHVGFLSGVGQGRLLIRGGNQSNRVSDAPFPSSRLIAMLWPRIAPPFHHYPKAPTIDASGALVSDG